MPLCADNRHAERTCLATKSRTIVVRPERRWRQVGMQLSCNFPQRERVLIHSTWRGDHDSRAGQRQRLDILGQQAARWPRRKRLPHCPRQGQSSAGCCATFQKRSSRYHGTIVANRYCAGYCVICETLVAFCSPLRSSEFPHSLCRQSFACRRRCLPAIGFRVILSAFSYARSRLSPSN